MREVRQEKEKWKIVGVYASEGIERMLRKLNRRKRGKNSGEGDFNARIGKEGGGMVVGEEKEGEGGGEGKEAVRG